MSRAFNRSLTNSLKSNSILFLLDKAYRHFNVFFILNSFERIFEFFRREQPWSLIISFLAFLFYTYR